MNRFLPTAVVVAGLFVGIAFLKGTEVGPKALSGAAVEPVSFHMGDLGWEAFSHGDINGAEVTWLREMNEAAARGDDQAVARLMYNLSYIKVARDDYASAIELLRRSILEMEEDLDFRIVAEQRLAALLDQEGLHKEAEQVWEERLARPLVDTSAARQQRAGVLLNLAAHYVNRGQAADAERAYALGLATVSDEGGPSITHESLFEGLSLLYAKQQRFPEAVQMSARRVELVERSSGRGERLADVIDMHARILDLAGLHSEAEEARATASDFRGE